MEPSESYSNSSKTSKTIPRNIKIISGIVGLIQGCAWTALTLLAGLLLSCAVTIKQNDDAFGNALLDYFTSSNCPAPGNKADPTHAHAIIMNHLHLHIWSWIYFVFSFYQIVSSGMLLFSIDEEDVKTVNKISYNWSATTLALSVFDISLMIMFAVDYNNMPEGNYAKYTAAIFLMIMASRGFVLLIINVVLAIMLLFYTLQVTEPINDVTEDNDDEDEIQFWGRPQVKTKKLKGHEEEPPSPIPSNTHSWQPPIDAFSYSNDPRLPPWQMRPSSIVQPTSKPPDNGYHPGWTLRRDPSYLTSPPHWDIRQQPKHEREAPRQKQNQPFSEPLNVPLPDYSPILPRVKPMVKPLRPAIKPQSQYGPSYY